MIYPTTSFAHTAQIATSKAITIQSVRMVLSHAQQSAKLAGPEVTNVH